MEELSLILNSKIKENYIYKKYIELKVKIDNDEFLKGIKSELDCLKNRICKNKESSLVDEYYKLEKEYQNHHLIKEYLLYKEDMIILQ